MLRTRIFALAAFDAIRSLAAVLCVHLVVVDILPLNYTRNYLRYYNRLP